MKRARQLSLEGKCNKSRLQHLPIAFLRRAARLQHFHFSFSAFLPRDLTSSSLLLSIDQGALIMARSSGGSAAAPKVCTTPCFHALFIVI